MEMHERDPFDNAVLFDGAEMGDAWISAQSGTPYDGNVVTPQPAVPSLPAPNVPSPTNFPSINQAIANVTGAAMAVLQVQQAYRAIKNPPVRTMDVASSTGTSRTPGNDGYLTVRNAQGQVVGRELPSAGVPYALANGTVIVNNGNGTFSRIASNGTKSTVRYGSPAKPIKTTTPTIKIGPFSGGFASTTAIVVAALGLIGAAVYFSQRRGRA